MVYLRKAHQHHPANRFTARAKQEHAEDWIRDSDILTYPSIPKMFVSHQICSTVLRSEIS